MERLTKRTPSGIALSDNYSGFVFAGIRCGRTASQNQKIQAAIERLAEIEDILGDNYDLNSLRELVEADRDGRCVVLPCKAGDTVYLITEPENVVGLDPEEFIDEKFDAKMIFECKVGSTTIYENELHAHVRLYHNGKFVVHYIRPVDFGKCVFFNREAAEAALKGE